MSGPRRAALAEAGEAGEAGERRPADGGVDPLAGTAVFDHEALLPAAPARGTATTAGGRRARGGVPSPRGLWLAALAAGLVASLVASGIGRRPVVNAGGWESVRRFFAAAVAPELSAPFLRVVGEAALTTLSYAVLGTVLSLAAGVVGGVLASQTWWRRPGRRRPSAAGPGWVAARGVLGIPRGVHEAVWALLLVNVLGADPLTAVLAIAIPYGAVTAKVYAEVLDETPAGAFGALRAAGAGRLQALAYSLGPQALPDLVSYAFYRFECSIRAAAILGFVGAAGLGFQLELSFTSLRYGEMWTLVYALVALSGAADLWSRAVRSRLRGPRAGGRDRGTGPPRRDGVLVWSAATVAALVAVSVWHLGVEPARLVAARTRALAGDLVAAALPPRLSWGAAVELARLSLETMAMAFTATALAAAAAMAAAVVAARRGAAGAGARLVLLICRAVPPPVWALVFLFVLFPGPLPGALALATYNFGILGRLMGEVVENLDPAPARALGVAGVPPGRAFLYAVASRALPRFASFAVYRWEVTIRETVVVGLVGAGGLGRLLSDQLIRFDYASAVVTIAALIVLTLLVDLAGSSLRRALR